MTLSRSGSYAKYVCVYFKICLRLYFSAGKTLQRAEIGRFQAHSFGLHSSSNCVQPASGLHYKSHTFILTFVFIQVEKEWDQVVPKIANIQVPSAQMNAEQENVSKITVEVDELDFSGRKKDASIAENGAADVIL